MFGSEHDRLRHGCPAQRRLIGCHAPVVVQRLSNSYTYLLADELKKLSVGRNA